MSKSNACETNLLLLIFNNTDFANIGDAGRKNEEETLGCNNINGIHPINGVYICSGESASGKRSSQIKEVSLDAYHIDGIDAW